MAVPVGGHFDPLERFYGFSPSSSPRAHMLCGLSGSVTPAGVQAALAKRGLRRVLGSPLDHSPGALHQCAPLPHPRPLAPQT